MSKDAPRWPCWPEDSCNSLVALDEAPRWPTWADDDLDDKGESTLEKEEAPPYWPIFPISDDGETPCDKSAASSPPTLVGGRNDDRDSNASISANKESFLDGSSKNSELSPRSSGRSDDDDDSNSPWGELNFEPTTAVTETHSALQSSRQSAVCVNRSALVATRHNIKSKRARTEDPHCANVSAAVVSPNKEEAGSEPHVSCQSTFTSGRISTNVRLFEEERKDDSYALLSNRNECCSTSLPIDIKSHSQSREQHSLSSLTNKDDNSRFEEDSIPGERLSNEEIDCLADAYINDIDGSGDENESGEEAMLCSEKDNGKEASADGRGDPGWLVKQKNEIEKNDADARMKAFHAHLQKEFQKFVCGGQSS